MVKTERIPKKILQMAQKVSEKAIAENTTSRILRSTAKVAKMLYFASTGDKNKTVLADACGIFRSSLNNLLRRGEKKPNSSAGLFLKYFNQVSAAPRIFMMNRLKEVCLKEDADPRVIMSVLKMQNRDLNYDPNPEKTVQQITNNTLVINNKIESLNPEERREFIKMGMEKLGIELKNE